ncbi:MAG TPA: hypothetical protein VI564_09310 [Candidatus Nanoarchaeia archaeon]|nr:hypothetical protein [Candidatus Nanoarchaeia archaeon]
MTDSVELAIGNINDQLSEIRSRIVYFRKKGIDTKIANLKIASIPSKISMLSVTRDLNEVSKITKLITLVKNEIADLEQEELNRQNQIDDTLSELEKVNLLVKRIGHRIDERKIEEAKLIYGSVAAIYKNLSREEKKEVIGRLADIRARLSK